MKYSENEKKILARAGRILEKAAKYSAEKFTCAVDAQKFLSCKLQAKEHEVFAVMFLDSKHSLIEYQEVFSGTIDGAAVYPRRIAQLALQHNAAAVILAHNHPSGNPEPSEADKRITQRLKDALELLEVRVLDHVIVGKTTTSFASRGIL